MQRSWGMSVILLLCVSGFVALGVVPVSWWQEQFAYGQGDAVNFVVPADVSENQLAEIIVAQGITRPAEELVPLLADMGIVKTLRSGIYAARPGTPWEVAMQLQGQTPRAELFVLEEGIQPQELMLRLPRTGLDTATLLASDDLFPEPLRSLLPGEPESRTALLLPGIYVLSPDLPSTESIIRQASAAWWSKLGDQLGDADAQEILSRASLAALVQKEAAQEGDRAALAGVYVNRLAREIPLQSAAAIRFGLAREGLNTGALTRNELRIDSPYNTFQRPGLPPSPICLPSEASWRAALRPENHEFLFVSVQGDGHLVFSRTYKDHIAASGDRP